MTLKRILFVDDSLLDTELALIVFRKYHLRNEVVAVRDGVEALDYLYHRGEFADRAGGDPAMIVMDLRMPRMGGVEVLRVIKGDPRLDMIPVIMMVSSPEDQDAVKSHNLGVNGYIQKPLEFHALIEAAKLLGASWTVLSDVPDGTVLLEAP